MWEGVPRLLAFATRALPPGMKQRSRFAFFELLETVDVEVQVHRLAARRHAALHGRGYSSNRSVSITPLIMGTQEHILEPHVETRVLRVPRRTS